MEGRGEANLLNVPVEFIMKCWHHNFRHEGIAFINNCRGKRHTDVEVPIRGVLALLAGENSSCSREIVLSIVLCLVVLAVVANIQQDFL